MKLSEIDIVGGLIFGGFCVLTVGFSNIVTKQGQWDNGGMLFLLAVVITAVILVIIEKGHKNPVIKVEFLKTSIIKTDRDKEPVPLSLSVTSLGVSIFHFIY